MHPRNCRLYLLPALVLMAIGLSMGLADNTAQASNHPSSGHVLEGVPLQNSRVPLPTIALTPTPTGTPTPACGLAWRSMPDPPGWEPRTINGLVALSPDNVWGVGSWAGNTGTDAFSEHWDGSTWTAIAAETPGNVDTPLYAVDGIAQDDIWAVGSMASGSATLVEHWDGSAWSIVPSPISGGSYTGLYGVVVLAWNDVWAVGTQYNAISHRLRGLVVHWDGSNWSVVPSPYSDTEYGVLTSVAAVSPGDIWAAGYYAIGAFTGTRIEHWDGAAWTIVPSPNPDPNYNQLRSIEAISANDIWAGGRTFGVATQSMLMHWDGAAWNSVSNPGDFQVDGLSATSSSDIWAVGGGRNALRWNGSAWVLVNMFGNYDANDVVAISSQLAWAAGTILQRYNDPCGTPAPTNTPTVTLTGTPPTSTMTTTPTSTRTATNTPMASFTPTPILTPTPTFTGSAVPGTATTTATPVCSLWLEVAQYPTTDFSLMSAALNGDVYGFGGRDASYTRLASAYRYDPGTGRWTQLASMPQICFWCSAVTVNGQIWIVNGSHDQGGSSNSSIYDPVQNSWSAGINGLVATYGQSVVYLNGVIYRIGGLGDSGYSNTIEDYGHRLLAPMPQGVAWAQAAAIGGYIYVAGGSTAGGLTAKTYRYDPATDSWDDAAIADLPESRGWAGSGVVDGRWVIVGGVGTEGSALQWDPQTNSWSSIAPPLYPRSDMGAAVAGGNLYLIGGLAATLNEVTAKTQRYDPSACMTPTPTSTSTATLTTTDTPTPAITAVGSVTPTPSPTGCALQFIDVPQGSTFYPYIRCLACLGIVSGYPDGTFRPGNNVTRGQLAKIISNAAAFNDPQQTQMFEDVPPGSTFFDFIGRLTSRGFMQGYPCGGDGEACVPPANLPYFRPNNNATRGQIAKIDTNAAGINDTPSGQLFEDVPLGSTYYTVTYRAAAHAIMSGYTCGGQGDPCLPPNNLPYFRPNNNATRGQSSKVVSLTFFPECNLPD